LEVTLKIEAHQLGNNVLDLFKSLTEEQRIQSAKDVVDKWLRSPYDVERLAYAQNVISHLRQSHIRMGYSDKFTDDPNVTDSQISDTFEYRDKMAKFRSSREQMISMAAEEAVKQYRESVVDLVKNDPGVQAVYDSVKKRIESTFPQMAQAALVNWFQHAFSRSIFEVPSLTLNIGDEVTRMNERIREIEQQLGNR